MEKLKTTTMEYKPQSKPEFHAELKTTIQKVKIS